MRNIIVAIGTWLALALAPLPAADRPRDSETHGILTGVVFNRATRDNLANAVVTVEGTDLSARTDRAGRFRIERVPTGERQLRIVYTGLDPASASVSVRAGGNEVPPIGLTSEIYNLDRFVVTGIREGSAAAISSQREAPNIMTVMATDSFGDISDGNLGDFLKRLPGINAGGVSEVTSIGLRGLNSNHTSITLDGVRLPSPGGQEEGTQGDTRSFQVDKFPADYIETIEVIKAPTPAMDADAIGGTVNLRTKSAFTARERAITYRFGINHQTFTGSNAPYGSMTYSDMIGNRLGVVVTANYSEQYQDRDHSRINYDSVRDPVSGGFPITKIEMIAERSFRERTGIGVKFDYRLGDNGALNFGFVYNDYVQKKTPNEYVLEIGANQPTLRQPGANELRTVYGVFDATGRLIRGGREFIQSNNHTITQKVFSWQAGGEHRLASGWVIDYQGTFAPGRGVQERYLFNVGTAFQPTPAGLVATGAIIERKDLLDTFPALKVTHGGLASWNFPAVQDNHSIFKRWGDADQRVWSASLNVRKDFATRLPVTLQSGVRYRGQRFWSDYYEDGRRARTYDIARVGGDWNQFKDPSYSRTLFGLDQYSASNIPTMLWANPRKVFEFTVAHPEGWLQRWSAREVREAIQNDGQVREEVLAGYIQSSVKLGRQLTVLGGVRMEKTLITASGFMQDQQSPRPQPDPLRGTKEEWVEYYNREFKVHRNERTYTNAFPGLHLRYEVPRVRGLLARLSYSGGITRPSYGTLIPKSTASRFAVDPNDPEAAQSGRLVLNNTGLLPQMSKSYDFSLEYYFEPIGLLSFGAFQKDLRNFVYNVDDVITADHLGTYDLGPEFLGWQLQTKVNRGRGRVRGYEVAYSQQLGGMARWLQGFSAYASYARTVVEGELQGIIPEVIKVGVAYERSPVLVRFHYNANARRQTNFSANPFNNRYQEGEPDLEMNLRYTFSPKFSIFADVTNLLDTPMVERQGSPDDPAIGYRHFRYTEIGRKISFGIRGRF